jgi:hypothetical protein
MAAAPWKAFVLLSEAEGGRRPPWQHKQTDMKATGEQT